MGLTPGRIAIKWLLLWWVTVFGQVRHLAVINIIDVNSVFHLSGVGESSTGMSGWGRGGGVHLCRVAAAYGMCDPTWQMTLRSSAISFCQLPCVTIARLVRVGAGADGWSTDNTPTTAPLPLTLLLLLLAYLPTPALTSWQPEAGSISTTVALTAEAGRTARLTASESARDQRARESTRAPGIAATRSGRSRRKPECWTKASWLQW